MREKAAEVWVAAISGFDELPAELDRLLTLEERTYVQGFRSPGTPRMSRALLRLVLSRYLDLPPAEVVIDRSCPTCGRPHGRPRLRTNPAAAPLDLAFSVAHGGGLLVLAFAALDRVGVDVEPTSQEEPVPELLDFTLTAAERQRVLEAAPSQRRQVFGRYWTGKEAVLKALGTGLEVPPQQVSLPLLPERGVASVQLPGTAAPVHLWVRELDVGPGHVCSLATDQPVTEVRLVPLTPEILY